MFKTVDGPASKKMDELEIIIISCSTTLYWKMTCTCRIKNCWTTVWENKLLIRFPWQCNEKKCCSWTTACKQELWCLAMRRISSFGLKKERVPAIVWLKQSDSILLFSVLNFCGGFQEWLGKPVGTSGMCIFVLDLLCIAYQSLGLSCWEYGFLHHIPLGIYLDSISNPSRRQNSSNQN